MAKEDSSLGRQERIPCIIHRTASEIASTVANRIVALIRQRAEEGRRCVLGLATGSTMVSVYRELVRLHQVERLSLRNVVTFNLDEYYPMQPDAMQSYVRFMHEHLLDHVDIEAKNIHIPDGTLPIEKIADHCHWYESQIEAAGGIDLQLLGIGRNGHIGFNEPGSDHASKTRLITLASSTRIDATGDFFGLNSVPRRAITMGVKTILQAREIVLVALGESKASVIAQAVEGETSSACPASYLQRHDQVQLLIDEAAAAALTRSVSGWLVGPVAWNDPTTRRAVVWLSERVGKPVLKLTDGDYNENGLQDLLAEHGSAYEINLLVFRQLQATVTGWPGGKPDALKQPGDRPRPNDEVFPKRVIVFSPHPDDDVISMGGTLIRLAEQGHEVHVAYQTSGNIAVFDADALRFIEYVSECCEGFGIKAARIAELEAHVDEFLRRKQPGQIDSETVRRLKGLIRRGEARAGARHCGVATERIHFLDMPFYETGGIKKNPLGDEDRRIVREFLRHIQPHQIYAAGDLSDPHGTHRTCLAAILQSCDACRSETWLNTCEVWLYRGAWQEWAPHQIEMAVPLSPQEVERKQEAIFKHQSQKDRAMFPGSDCREFWQRAQERNAETARRFDALGLPEYEAIEGFVRWKGDSSVII